MKQINDIPLEQIMGAVTMHRDYLSKMPQAAIDLPGVHERAQIQVSEQLVPNEDVLNSEITQLRKQFAPYLEMISPNVHQKMIELICSDSKMLGDMKDVASRNDTASTLQRLIESNTWLGLLNSVCDDNQRRFIIDSFYILSQTNEAGFKSFLDAGINARYIETKGFFSVIYITENEAVKLMRDLEIMRGMRLPNNENKRDKLAHTDRFLREIIAGLELQHPNILGIKRAIMAENVDINDEDANMFAGYSMEIIDGFDLDEIDLHTLPPQYRDWIFLQIMRAIAFAHHKGFFHRDLKPGNVMFAKNKPVDEQIKVIDFGLVRNDISQKCPMPQVTKPGASIGTPLYMAPEQWQAKPEMRSDVYALGIMLYEAITGKVPYNLEGVKGLAIGAIIMMDEPKLEFDEQTSELTRQVIATAIQKNVNNRYNNAGEMYYAFYQSYMQKYHSDEVLAPPSTTGEYSLPPIPNIAYEMYQQFTGESVEKTQFMHVDNILDVAQTTPESIEYPSIKGSRKVALLCHLIAEYKRKASTYQSTPLVENLLGEINKPTHVYPSGEALISENSYDTRLWQVSHGELILRVDGQEVIKIGKGGFIGNGELFKGVMKKGSFDAISGNCDVEIRNNQTVNYGTALSELKENCTGEMTQAIDQLLDNQFNTIGEALQSLEYYNNQLTPEQKQLRKFLHLYIRNSTINPILSGVTVCNTESLQGSYAYSEAEEFYDQKLIPALMAQLKTVMVSLGHENVSLDICQSATNKLLETYPASMSTEADIQKIVREVYEEIDQFESYQTLQQTHEKVERPRSEAEMNLLAVVYSTGSLLEPELLQTTIGAQAKEIHQSLKQQGFTTGEYPYIFLTLKGKKCCEYESETDQYVSVLSHQIYNALECDDLNHCIRVIEHMKSEHEEALNLMHGSSLFEALIQKTLEAKTISIDTKIKLYLNCYRYLSNIEMVKKVLTELNTLLIQTGDYPQARAISEFYYDQFIQNNDPDIVFQEGPLTMFSQYFDILTRYKDWDRMEYIAKKITLSQTGDAFQEGQLKILALLLEKHAQLGKNMKENPEKTQEFVEQTRRELEANSYINLALNDTHGKIRPEVKRNIYLVLQRLCAWTADTEIRKRGMRYGKTAIETIGDEVNSSLMQAIIVNRGVVGRIIKAYDEAMLAFDDGAKNNDESLNPIGEMYRLINFSEFVRLVRDDILENNSEKTAQTINNLKIILTGLNDRSLIPDEINTVRSTEDMPKADHYFSSIPQIINAINSGLFNEEAYREVTMSDMSFLLLELRQYLCHQAHESTKISKAADQKMITYGNLIQTLFDKIIWQANSKRDQYAAYFGTERQLNFMPKYFDSILDLYTEADEHFEKKLQNNFMEVIPLPVVVGETMIAERIKFLNTVEFFLSEWERESIGNKPYVKETREKLKMQIKSLMTLYKPLMDKSEVLSGIVKQNIEFPNRAFGILKDRLEQYSNKSGEYDTQSIMIQTINQEFNSSEEGVTLTAEY